MAWVCFNAQNKWPFYANLKANDSCVALLVSITQDVFGISEPEKMSWCFKDTPNMYELWLRVLVIISSFGAGLYSNSLISSFFISGLINCSHFHTLGEHRYLHSNFLPMDTMLQLEATITQSVDMISLCSQ